MALYKIDFAYTTTIWDQLEMDLDPTLDKYGQEDAIHDRLRMVYPEGRDFDIEDVTKIDG